MWTEKDQQFFMQTYEKIKHQLGENLNSYWRNSNKLSDRVISYNLPHGKKIRGRLVVEAFRTFVGEENVTEDTAEMSRIVGWCVIVLHSSFIIIDDIVDKSVTRHNQKCWYLVDPECAVVNSLWLLSSMTYLLRKNCSQHRNYQRLLQTFLEVAHTTIIGGNLDMIPWLEALYPRGYIEEFTHSMCEKLARYKTAHLLLLSIKAAMNLANIDDEEMYAAADRIVLRIGIWFQAQDDFIDVYGDEAVTGKKGSDIQDGKCSWLAAEAVENMNHKQKELFKSNYGVNDEKSINVIKGLFNELNMKERFRFYEEKELKAIDVEIRAIESKYPKLAKVLSSILDIYNKRQK